MMENLTNKLPEDLFVQILLSLPVRSLLRFRCTSKAWCNLIKNPSFIAMHLNHPIAENDYHVLIKRSLQDRVTSVLSVHSITESLSIVSPDLQIPHFNWHSVEVLGPCNGLVCFTNYGTIVLCNPAMRDFMLVPDRPFGCPQDMCCYYEGAGFGFDASTDDYKIVRFVRIEDDADYYEIDYRILKVEVYQYSTNSWKEVDAVLPTLWYMACFETFFLGAIHWYAERGPNEKILSFCMTNEVFQEFDFPDRCLTHCENRKSLTVLNESLALLFFTSPRAQTHERFINIWIMSEYGVSESWTKLFTVGPIPEMDHPLTSWKNSAILIEKRNGQLISCVIETKEIKEFDIFGYPTSLRSLVYKESLISVRK